MPRTGRLTTVAIAALAWGAAGPVGCVDDDRPADAAAHRVLVLGIDGMDPVLLRGLIEDGRMPNMARLAARGTFLPLATSAPPQSPVAWSNFICGADAGTHQIFDFIHRDPDPEDPDLAVEPYLSTSRVVPPERDWAIPLGSWRLPLFGGRPESLRRGGAFWDDLVAHGIDTAIWRAPANYPPPSVEGPGRFRCLCGMGTPDLLGTYGEFTFFAADVPAAGRAVAGGRFERLRMRDHRGTGTLKGPENFLRRPEAGPPAPLTRPFEIVRDPERDVAKIAIGDELVVLNVDEWSGWIPVFLETGFPASGVLDAAGLPTRVEAMVRFHLQQVHPTVELYASPLNIDPLRQVNPIATPGDFAEDVADACGRYYTTGIPEDTKALRAGALDEDDFLAQTELLKAERIRQYRHALSGFRRGFLFFYFGHVDQLSHIFWRDRDPAHPGHDAFEAHDYGTVVEDQYVEMDGLVGEAMAALDEDDTLIVMSDHGFASFRRGFHLNRWLVENGYQALTDPALAGRASYLTAIDWSRTRAYALGLNALYLNVIDRERDGRVAPGARSDLLEEIARGLLAVTDDDGAPVVETVYRVDRTYPGRDGAVAPDLIVGYAAGYRASWATAEGATPTRLLVDNLDRWSGDHCIAHELVPGIIVTNRRIVVPDPDLTDLAPTILREFDVEPPPVMTGRALLAPTPHPSERP